MNDAERQLVDLLLDGELPDAERANLLARLESDPAAVVYLAERALLHTELRHSMKRRAFQQDALATAAPAKGRTVRVPCGSWLSWRPLTAAAAGLMIGLCSASVVWAYAGSWPRAVELLRESFENAAMKLDTGFPQKAEVWSGDAALTVVAEHGVPPKDGVRMLRLEPLMAEMWNAQSFTVDLRQLAPAPAGALRVVRVAASFRAAPSEMKDRYMARAAAFVEAPGEIDPRWMNDLWGSEENHALATAARATTFSAGAPDWQTLNLTMDLPPGSRFLIISLRAATMHGKPEMRAAHYLDDVRVSLETLQTQEAKP